jgi:hypothetical protein
MTLYDGVPAPKVIDFGIAKRPAAQRQNPIHRLGTVDRHAGVYESGAG